MPALSDVGFWTKQYLYKHKKIPCISLPKYLWQVLWYTQKSFRKALKICQIQFKIIHNRNNKCIIMNVCGCEQTFWTSYIMKRCLALYAYLDYYGVLYSNFSNAWHIYPFDIAKYFRMLPLLKKKGRMQSFYDLEADWT